MFMAGLTLLQSLRVALTGAKFALDRFKIPQQYASSFINMVHNPMELATFTGMAIVTITTLCTDSSNDGFRYLAIVTNVTLCLSFTLLLIAFMSGGQMGNLTFYYWAIVLASFIYGMNVACVMNVGSANASFFNMGIPISGIQVSIYYYIFTKLAERFNWSNVSYWIIFWQLIIAILISAASAIVWTIAYYPGVGVLESLSKTLFNAAEKVLKAVGDPGGTGGVLSRELWEALGKAAGSVLGGSVVAGLAGISVAVDLVRNIPDPPPKGTVWSPILMGVVGMGGIYAFYPAIAPYKLTDVGTGYTIDLVVLFASAVPGIIIAVLCDCGKGPNRPWNTANSGWHFTWVLAVPHITAMIFCLVTLHYPDGRVASSIKSSGLKVGVITVTLKFCEEGLKAVSYAGGGAYGGVISSVNAFTSQGLMIILAFTGDGYLKTYSKYEHDRSKWPTKHFGFWRSIWFWTGNGMWVACKSVKSSFTTNVRCKVLGKSEALLIVYADEEF